VLAGSLARPKSHNTTRKRRSGDDAHEWTTASDPPIAGATSWRSLGVIDFGPKPPTMLRSDAIDHRQ
jgi:hypothetical protein